MTQVHDRLTQEFEEYCRRAYESGDRPVGRDASGWVARKSADFFSGKIDMSDAQNAALIAILRQVADWDVGDNPPPITVTRIEEEPPPAGAETQVPPPTEQIDPWAEAAGASPDSSGAGAVEQVVDDEMPDGLT